MGKFEVLKNLYEQLAECTDSLKQIKDNKILSIAITMDNCLDDVCFYINNKSDTELKIIGDCLQNDLKEYLEDEEQRLKDEIDKII